MGTNELRGLAADLCDLVLPRSCALCQQARGTLCRGCAGEVLEQVRSFAGPCRVVPEPEPVGFPPCVALGPYAGGLGRLVAAYKDSDRVDLAPLLGTCLAEAVDRIAGGPQAACVLVPVPSSAGARRRRGRDPLSTLAEICARARDGPTLVRPILGVTRRVADQAGLDARSRQRNLLGAFVTVADLTDRERLLPVVVVDDVVTTGATLVAASRALAAQPPVTALAATICATRRRASMTDALRPLSRPPVVG